MTKQQNIILTQPSKEYLYGIYTRVNLITSNPLFRCTNVTNHPLTVNRIESDIYRFMIKLEDIIAPLSIEGFIENYKGKKHFLTKGAPARFKDLFSWERLNEVLGTSRIDYPRLRLLKDGAVIDPSLYINYKQDNRQGKIPNLKVSEIKKHLNTGTAVHIMSIEEFSDSLRRICNDVASELFTETSMTMHIGMLKSKGLDVHWDSHDVFVMQVYGRKRWKLYGFTESSPFREGPSKREKIMNDIIWEGDLNEGDVLYLPRGLWHEAIAYDEPCMHISLGMYNSKISDYLRWLNTQLLQLEFFRKDIAVSLNETECDMYLSEVKSRFGDLITYKTYQSFLIAATKRKETENFDFPTIK